MDYIWEEHKELYIGIIFGIFIDIWIGKILGITSIALALIGVISGILDKTFSKDSRLIVLIMGIICTIIYEIAVYIMQYIVIGINIEILQFIKTLLIEVIYNRRRYFSKMERKI